MRIDTDAVRGAAARLDGTAAELADDLGRLAAATAADPTGGLASVGAAYQGTRTAALEQGAGLAHGLAQTAAELRAAAERVVYADAATASGIIAAGRER